MSIFEARLKKNGNFPNEAAPGIAERALTLAVRQLEFWSSLLTPCFLASTPSAPFEVLLSRVPVTF